MKIKIVTAAELGKHFGIGTRRVEQLAKDKIFPRSKRRGKFELSVCTRLYIRHLKQWRLEAEIPASTNDLARCFQISPTTIRELVKAGVLPKISHGRFCLIACVRAYVKYLENGQLSLQIGEKK